jgi:POT family proton-dependent oligopeptide transporter
MAARTLLCAAKNKFRLDAAKPTYQLENFGKTVPWDETFIAEMKRGLIACRVMLVKPSLIQIGKFADTNYLDSPSFSSTYVSIRYITILSHKPVKCS